jgi:hypothetical protein
VLGAVEAAVVAGAAVPGAAVPGAVVAADEQAAAAIAVTATNAAIRRWNMWFSSSGVSLSYTDLAEYRALV